MKVYVPTETKFFKNRVSNVVFPCHPVHTADFWKRYLDVFERVILSGRLVQEKLDNVLPPATNENIEFFTIASTGRIVETIGSLISLSRTISKDHNAAVCLRMPTLISSLVGFEMLRKKRPFGVEVVGDPADAFSNKLASTIPFRRILRAFLFNAQKLLCRKAIATAYVTERALQKRYPPKSSTFTTHFSSIQMSDDYFRQFKGKHPQIATRLISVGSMGKTLYKGQDVLLEALAILRRKYRDIHLILVGGGAGLPVVERKIGSLGFKDIVLLQDHVSNISTLRKLLDESHLFILPSLVEGLPKALIEAMARGLPAIASDVGGNSELLDKDALVPVSNRERLAAKMGAFIESRTLRESASRRNYQKALEYHIDSIRPRRIAYYNEVLHHTQAWQKRETFI